MRLLYGVNVLKYCLTFFDFDILLSSKSFFGLNAKNKKKIGVLSEDLAIYMLVRVNKKSSSYENA